MTDQTTQARLLLRAPSQVHRARCAVIDLPVHVECHVFRRLTCQTRPLQSRASLGKRVHKQRIGTRERPGSRTTDCGNNDTTGTIHLSYETPGSIGSVNGFPVVSRRIVGPGARFGGNEEAGSTVIDAARRSLVAADERLIRLSRSLGGSFETRGVDT